MPFQHLRQCLNSRRINGGVERSYHGPISCANLTKGTLYTNSRHATNSVIEYEQLPGVSQLANVTVPQCIPKPPAKSQYRPFSVYVPCLRPRKNSTTQTNEANSIKAVAAQVIPRNLLPLYAAMPMSAPCLLTVSTALTMTAVEIAEAMPRVRNASCVMLVSFKNKGGEGATPRTNVAAWSAWKNSPDPT